MISISGYQHLVCIYESTSSLIFRARRQEDNLPVILKLLKENCPSQSDLIHYRQEYKMTSALQGRAGVIQALGMGDHGSSIFIVFEDFGGDSLQNGLSSWSLSLAERISLAEKMAGSLGEVHSARIIHKDVNLGNAVYNPETKVLKLIDFGISTQLSRECPETRSPNVLEGTLAYISPEQTGRMNRPIDYRTDFYSLGVACYQLFTGTLPFATQDPMELVHCHIARDPVPPSQISTDVPEILSNIVLKLMAKTPEDRYQSAFGIQHDLQRCREQLEMRGQVVDFVLAQRDIPDRFVVPQKLYGREQELRTLLQSFDQVAAGGKQITLLAGLSGTGKTALVQELYKPMTERRGYFVSGKFDALQRDLPYKAFSEAFKQLMRHFLTEPEECLRQRKKELLHALGPNGKVIAEVIPELELVIGPQPAVDEVGPQESQNRFNYVFQNFIQAVAQPGHPLILFIDDLQWVDAASLALLKLILTTPEIQSLHLIAAYRDNEVSPTHPWMLAVKDLTEVGCKMSSIAVGPLDVDLVNQFLSDALRREPEETRDLAEMVHSKTRGNPFFMTAFLHMLDKSGLLALDRQSGSWLWNLAQIRSLGITDNAADLMTSSILRLEPETQRAMSLAACIGNRFELRTLSVISESSPKQALSLLQPALAEGFVLPLGSEYKAIEHNVLRANEAQEAAFKFSHDRVQQAAYALIPQEQRKALHWKIGKLLQTAGGDVVDVVNHLNFSVADLTDPAEQQGLARLNLLAGKRAKSAAAYAQAMAFLAKSQALLGADGWDEASGLTRVVCEEAAEAAYLVGDYARALSLAEEVERHALNALDKANPCKLRILCHMALNQPRAAVDTGLTYLASLGYRLPRDPGLLRVAGELLRTKLRLSRTDIAALAHLREMTDEVKRAALLVMSIICPAALFCRPNLFVTLICRGARIELDHGLFPIFNFDGLAIVLAAALGDPRTGCELGEISLRMADKTSNRSLMCHARVNVNAFVWHWQYHLRDTTKALREAVQLGADCGDFAYASYAVAVYCEYRMLLGAELTDLESEMTSYNALIVRFGQNIPLAWNQSFRQLVLRLLGRPEEPYRLLDKVLDESAFLSHLEKSEQWIGVAGFHFTKLLLAVWFQDGQQAQHSAEAYEKHMEATQGIFVYGRAHFLAALAYLDACPHKRRGERRRLLAKANRYRRKLCRWARQAPMNHAHTCALVEAERCRVLGKHDQAMGFYQRSIELAHGHGWVHEEGLANELAGRYHLKRKEEDRAIAHLQAARGCYRKWGAKAKVEQLEKTYEQLLSGARLEGRSKTLSTVTWTQQPTTTTKSDMSALDLGSVVKASQNISQEVVLERLLEHLMRIVIENAGADRACLVLLHERSLQVEAYIDIKDLDKEGSGARIASVPLDQFGHISTGIVRLVARTLESLVLRNASQEGAFTNDAHVIDEKPKSLLCMPFLRHGSLTGVLYLENRSATNAFTPERVEILNIFAAQAAISIENAKLYARLQNALIQAEESARIKAEFLAKTSHELRTPLNAIINLPQGMRTRFLPLERAVSCSACRGAFQMEEGEQLSPGAACPLCQQPNTLALAEEYSLDGSPREMVQMLEVVERNGRSLLAIIDDLLRFSDISQGTCALLPVRVNLGELLRGAERAVRAQARQRGIELLLAENVDEVFLTADREKLQQVFNHLINNAVKFSNAGGRVAVRETSSKEKIVVTVEDEGIGIAPEHQELIFQGFRQASGGNTRSHGGMGLGLAVAKSYVEIHGGAIWVESEPGKGSKFHVELPLARESP